MKTKTSTRLILTVVTAALAFTVIPVRASDPVGTYAIIDKVIETPNATAPTSVQVWGVFSLAIRRDANGNQPWPPGSFGTANTGDVYGPVQIGYLHYTCPAGKETLCRGEWSDLKALAGKADVVGFGSRWAATGRVRPKTEAVANPDSYPLNVGLVKMGMHGGTDMQNRSQYPDLINALKAAAGK